MAPKQEILEAVTEIIKTDPEGENFFSKIDEYLTKKASKEVYLQLFKMAEGNSLILSGSFGKMLADGIDNGTFPWKPYILFAGGVRKTGKVEMLREKGMHSFASSVMIDDSIYGGKTYNIIKEYLESTTSIIVKKCIVAYDGCPVKREWIQSVFRYYDEFTAKPNFKFDY